MKKSTKFIAAAVTGVAMCVCLSAKAQTSDNGGLRFGIGLEAGAPTGNAHRDLSNVYAGATARFQASISDNLAVIATGGFYNMFDKNVTANGITAKSPGLGIVPLKGGLKGFLGKGIFFTAEAGAGFETSKDDATGEKDIKTIVAGGLGYAKKSWELSVRYESFTGQDYNYGLIGLRLAYGFQLVKGN